MAGGYGYGGPGGAPPGGGWPPQGPPPGGGAPPGGGYGAPPQPGYGAPPGVGYAQTAVGQMPGPAGYAAPPMGASFGAHAGGQYEFSAAENDTIDKLSGRLTIAGIMQMVFGGLQVFFGWAFGLPGWLVGLPGCIALVAIGALFVSAASSFRSVTQTRGHDVSHLMGALGKLSTAAIVQIVGYIVAVVLGVIIGMLVLFVFAAVLAGLR